MRIALLTEGAAEYGSLPALLPQINRESPNTFLKPLKINVAPDVAPGIIARECKSRISIAAAKGADLVVVVLDREQQNTCPGQIARILEAAIIEVCTRLPVRVVLKDRLYENWLIADMNALACQPKRFQVTKAKRKKVEPNKADQADGLALIKSMAVGPDYNKVQDAAKICHHLDIFQAALHSRSFRHFLHIAGIPQFTDGCKSPKGEVRS